MMYPFMTLNDQTEIVHSDPFLIDGVETVKVYFERPVAGGFDCAQCLLPQYQWENIEGFSEKEIAYFNEFLSTTAHIIIELAREGGIVHAANI
ncbi:MAG: hypothetical protein KHY77_11420 [Butyricicoccus pullicaecorum]|nr:hypothetical protein [Butyricicoccus pullicaecorum]